MAKVCIFLSSLCLYPVSRALINPIQVVCQTLKQRLGSRDAGTAALLGRSTLRFVRALWCRGNGRGANAPRWAMISIVLLASAARAQDLAPPGPSDVYRTYNAIEGWVRSGASPGATPEGSLPAVQAASVSLVLDGKRLGRATVASLDASPAVIQRAALGVVRDLDPSLSAAQRARIQISIELAGALVPYHADTIEELALGLSPGLEGVAVERNGRTEAAFPGAMLTRGIGPAIATVGLVNALGSDAQDALATPQQLRERGYTIYRFESVHLAQPAAGSGAVFVHRGGRAVDGEEINARTMIAMGDAMAGYLMGLRWPGVEAYGLLGAQDPTTGRYDPPFANPVEQAVAALALLRYAEVRDPDPRAAAARLAAVGVLEKLGDVEEDELEPWTSPHNAAAVVLALAELGSRGVSSSPALAELLDKCRATLHRSYDPTDGYADGLPQPAWGLIAGALVADHARLGSGAFNATELDAAVRLVYRDTGPSYLVGQMPWLGWAELELEGITGRRTPAAPALRAMRRLTWDHQLRTDDLAHEDRDLAGGVVFTSATTPLPTWNLTRPLAFIATMVGDERFTRGSPVEGEVPGELVRLLGSLRFVRQLMADDSNAHMFARPARSSGGVRAALWDQTITPEATAMGLLTVCETLESMDAAAARMPGAAGG